MKKLTFILSIIMVLGFSSLSNATLWDRGGGLIYDDVLNITWLQDAGYANIHRDWSGAVAWADQLTYAGYDDWRLPATVDGLETAGLHYDGTTTSGWNITSSEMGYMYYVNLGNIGMYGLDGTVFRWAIVIPRMQVS